SVATTSFATAPSGPGAPTPTRRISKCRTLARLSASSMLATSSCDLLLREAADGLRRDVRELDHVRRAVAAVPIVLDDLPAHLRSPEALQMVERARYGLLRILAMVEIRRNLVRHTNQLVHVHSPPA